MKPDPTQVQTFHVLVGDDEKAFFFRVLDAEAHIKTTRMSGARVEPRRTHVDAIHTAHLSLLTPEQRAARSDAPKRAPSFE